MSEVDCCTRSDEECAAGKRIVGNCHAIPRTSLEQCNLAGVKDELLYACGTVITDSRNAFHSIDYSYVSVKIRSSLPFSPTGTYGRPRFALVSHIGSPRDAACYMCMMTNIAYARPPFLGPRMSSSSPDQTCRTIPSSLGFMPSTSFLALLPTVSVKAVSMSTLSSVGW